MARAIGTRKEGNINTWRRRWFAISEKLFSGREETKYKQRMFMVYDEILNVDNIRDPIRPSVRSPYYVTSVHLTTVM